MNPAALAPTYSWSMGDLRIDAISDGLYPRRMHNLFQGVPDTQWAAVCGLDDPEDELQFSMNCFLIRGPQLSVLVDTGVAGAIPAPAGSSGWGTLLQSLAALEVSPEEINQVVHTHLHLDHCGWDTDADEVDPTFPNAQHLVSDRELAFWMSQDPEFPGPRLRERGVRARMRCLIEAGLLRTFTGEHQASPGITCFPTPGHTPGHSSVHVSSRGGHLILTGDSAYHHAHLLHPSWVAEIDVDADESARSRRALAERALRLDAQIAFSHMRVPPLGRLAADDADGYRWVPS